MRASHLFVLFAAAVTVAAQTAPGAPAFEVATIKPSTLGESFSRERGGPGTASPGQLEWTNVSLKELICRVYTLREEQLSGPSWLVSARFDVMAKLPTGATKDQLARMWQNLLAERFGMVFHREMKELPAYELVVAKSGLKMKLTAEPEPAGGAPAQPTSAPKTTLDKDGKRELAPGERRMTAITDRETGMIRISARGQTVSSLLRTTAFDLGRSVVDKTGLTGAYDFNVDFAPAKRLPLPAPPVPSDAQSPAEAASAPGGMSLPAALEKQLGLKLESKSAPQEMLIVDRIERTPTEN
jgi:uncharacterized protein (TIGR03435 family)